MEVQKKSRIISFLLIFALCITSIGNYSFAQSSTLPSSVVICGFPVGIKLQGDGVTVTGYMTNEGKKTGLNVGDRIISIDGKKINSSSSLQTELNNKSNDYVELEIIDAQTSENKKIRVLPIYDAIYNGYRLGVWVKDSAAGIGTLTFYDNKTHRFGSLGHGITDCGDIFNISQGTLQDVTIFDVERSRPGEPGELKGYFNDVNKSIAQVDINNQYGVYGYIEDDSFLPDECYEIEIGTQDRIHTGKAYIYTSLDGKKFDKYEIKITAINKNQSNATKTLSILVTDEDLICKTGGIVQGMSGSPIIQDGKLVGAVTHVLVNEPTRGYGIFIENMLEAAE